MLEMNLGQKLIITIVKKEKAKKVVLASKKAGARGGTTFFGNGIRLNEKSRFFGIPIEREREIILTLVPDDIYPVVMDAIINSVNLNKPRQGIGFVIDTKKVIGISQLAEFEDMETEDVNLKMEEEVMYDLIVTIVNKGDSEKVVNASQNAGAEGGTIINGRGTGIHEKAMLFNILIEPEKEVVLTLISKDKTKAVLKAIKEDADLKTAGKGIAFVIEVDETIGINHMLNRKVNEEFNT